MCPPVDEVETRRRCQFSCRARNEDFAGIREVENPRGLVHGETTKVARNQFHLTGVDRGAYLESTRSTGTEPRERGGGGIRTHETRIGPNGFQDRLLRPLGHPSEATTDHPSKV